MFTVFSLAESTNLQNQAAGLLSVELADSDRWKY